MYKCAYPYEIEDHNLSGTVEVVAAGISIVEECDTGVTRTDGLPDYQLVYIKEGAGHFKIDGEFIKISSGKAVLFRPGDPQIYRYFKSERPIVCWIHFTGSEIPTLLSDLNLEDKKIIHINDGNKLWNTINNIMSELTNKQDNFILATRALLLSVLVNISRNSNAVPKSKQQSLIESVCEKMRNEYELDKSVAEYAAECDMSVSYFLLLFKKFTGTTPHNYKLTLRITLAKDMLVQTDYKIGEIAKISGFDDPLYFSRYFTRLYGISPEKYRSQHRI